MDVHVCDGLCVVAVNKYEIRVWFWRTTLGCFISSHGAAAATAAAEATAASGDHCYSETDAMTK